MKDQPFRSLCPAEQVGPLRGCSGPFGRLGQSRRLHTDANGAESNYDKRHWFAGILPMAFPALTEEQIDRIRSLERIRQVRRGDILFKPGDTAFPFLYAALGPYGNRTTGR